ncbi:MAG: TolC family protein [Cellulophaga sp.]
MNKNIVFALCGCLFFIVGFAQNVPMGELLNEIEQNNIELKAYLSFIESRQLENKSSNNMPDPQFSGYYLPFGTNNTEAYTEFQISQSLEFPSVYIARRKWNDLKSQQLETAYSIIRQDVLLNAKLYMIELTILQGQKEIEVVRRNQSQQVFEQIQKLFNKEQVGILDLSKAKIVWIQEQFVVEQIDTEIRVILTALEKLNGGIPIEFAQQDIGARNDIAEIEILWQEKILADPFIQELKTREAASLQNVKLERNKVLPNLTIGYNYQGISGSNNSGFYGGISVPLWNSRNKVKAAEANYVYQQSNTEVVTTTRYVKYKEHYDRYRLLLKKYNEYQKIIGVLDSEALLFKAYMLGEFSFMEYYVELQFYHKALDRTLQMEKKLFQLKAQLLKHQL